MSNIGVFCTWTVLIVSFEAFRLTCCAQRYQMKENTSPLVFIIDTELYSSSNWYKIQHYMKLIADEFTESQRDIIKEFWFIQDGWCSVIVFYYQ